MKKLIAVLCSIAVISLATSFLLAQDPKKVTRVIKLDVVDPDSPFFHGWLDIPPKATLRILSYGGSGGSVEVDVWGLGARWWNEGSYALYIWKGGPDDYADSNVGRVIFNCCFNPSSTKCLSVGLGGGYPVAIDSPTISAFIAHVPDDGSWFSGDPFADAIFAGTSELP
jgi:hypothetical protein